MQVKEQQLDLDIEQLTGSISGKEYIQAIYCQIKSDDFLILVTVLFSGTLDTDTFKILIET